ncbi:peptide chain release factor N(5)-glutamine methyltransferase [Piscibacillus salipiscarius]|uniref:Release factor glutamine methyltransferase n=1 Tax=Piscibacillus salipiscarius TaxID=299480 RepID=A0ABW5QAB1_9BACI|nr:peptide chain release factor N(5)-glutamine methyltransferase [Piscibacillus salipiscarius]
MTVREARRWASSFLEQHNREARVADLLLMHLLDVELADFLLMQQEKLSEWSTFEDWVRDHADTGKPLEHFTGVSEFYGRKFSVSEHVLIPRPETEELIEAVKPFIQPNDTIVDVGTGSGIIAVTLKKEHPQLSMFATDISPDALKVASGNAERLGADVEFKQGNFLEPVINEPIDIVISNPPYVPESDRPELSETVMHDPELALFADDHGLAAYREIIRQIGLLRKPPRLVAFEIGYDQGESVPKLIQQADPEAVVQVLQDINGKDRMVLWS